LNGNHVVKGLKVIATVLGVMAVLAGLMTPTILWFIDRGAKQEAFRQHKIEMVQLKEDLKTFKNELDGDIKELKKWQTDWPTNPKGLALDGVQNEKIAGNKERIAENRKMIRDLEKH